MIVTRKCLPRRTVLRGLAATLALPLLESMSPAFARAQPLARRLCVVYLPNGIRMEHWTPAGDDGSLTLSPILQPLAPFRDRLTVITGLKNGPQHYAVHGAASTRFLTTMPPAASTGTLVEAGRSMDQLLAEHVGRETPLSSLELTLESSAAGVCDIGSSCVYTDTIAWRGASTPLPMEHNPRAVFERLFGDADGSGRAAEQARFGSRRRLLDSVTDAAADLARTLGTADRRKLDEYLDAVRDVERRIENTERRDESDVVGVTKPLGVPATFPEHARLMFDLQVLALRADITRVITFMMGRELSGRAYPEIGVHDAHHPTSHHQHDPDKLAKLTIINTHHVRQLAYFLDRLSTTTDGHAPLLEQTTILCGAGMSDGNAHAPDNLPVVLAGAGVGGGRHVRAVAGTPIGDLHVALLDKLGARVERFGNSSGRLAGI